MLLDKIPKQLLICTILVGNLEPEVVRHNDFSFLREWLTAVSQNVQPSSTALKRTGSAWSKLRSVPMAEFSPIAPKPGTGTL